MHLCLQHSQLTSSTLSMSCFRPTFVASVRVSSTISRRALSTVQDIPFSPPINTTAPPPAPTPVNTSPLQTALNATGPRHNWTKEEISSIYNTSLLELQYAAVSRDVPHVISRSVELVLTCLITVDIASPSLPQPVCYSNVHPPQHQDGWMQRRLQLLCSILPIRYWPESIEDGVRRDSARSSQNSKREWIVKILYGRRMARYARSQNEP